MNWCGCERQTVGSNKFCRLRYHRTTSGKSHKYYVVPASPARRNCADTATVNIYIGTFDSIMMINGRIVGYNIATTALYLLWFVAGARERCTISAKTCNTRKRSVRPRAHVGCCRRPKALFYRALLCVCVFVSFEVRSAAALLHRD